MKNPKLNSSSLETGQFATFIDWSDVAFVNLAFWGMVRNFAVKFL